MFYQETEKIPSQLVFLIANPYLPSQLVICQKIIQSEWPPIFHFGTEDELGMLGDQIGTYTMFFSLILETFHLYLLMLSNKNNVNDHKKAGIEITKVHLIMRRNNRKGLFIVYIYVNDIHP